MSLFNINGVRENTVSRPCGAYAIFHSIRWAPPIANIFRPVGASINNVSFSESRNPNIQFHFCISLLLLVRTPTTGVRCYILKKDNPQSPIRNPKSNHFEIEKIGIKSLHTKTEPIRYQQSAVRIQENPQSTFRNPKSNHSAITNP